MHLQKLVKELYKILEQVNSLEIPDSEKFPESFSEFLSDMKDKEYDAKTFAIRLKAMVCYSLFLCLLHSFPEQN